MDEVNRGRHLQVVRLWLLKLIVVIVVSLTIQRMSAGRNRESVCIVAALNIRSRIVCVYRRKEVVLNCELLEFSDFNSCTYVIVTCYLNFVFACACACFFSWPHEHSLTPSDLFSLAGPDGKILEKS